MRHSFTRYVLAALAVLTPATARAALEGDNVGKALRAERATVAPVIDGRLDDAAWAQTPGDERFRQTFPGDGVAPSVTTNVRIVYDDDAIYVGVRADDDEPALISRRLSRRDEDAEVDIIYIGFDSRLDHRSAFGFALTAAGVQTDFLLYNDTQISTDWDAVWDGAVSRDATGWSAEFRIPLSVLRFAEDDEQVWGFDLLRYIPRKKEEIHWAPTPRGVSANVSRWGHIEGIRGVKPRRTFELRPYWATAVEHGTTSGSPILGLDPHATRAATWNLGLDLKLGVTRGLTLDATINPDFGQVEADPAVLNLTRFESFFPEKRPFFLEGADVFELPIQVYYSRRIGRPPSGLGAGDEVLGRNGMPVQIRRAPAALPIWTAAKLAGSVTSDLTVAVLDAITGAERFEILDERGSVAELERAPARNYSAVRVRYGVGGTSSVGLLATGVTRLGGELASARADHDAYVQSGDLRWTPSVAWTLSGQGVLSERVGGPSREDGDGRACTAPAGDPTCTPITRPNGTRREPGDVGAGLRLGAEYATPDWLWVSFAGTLSPRLDINDVGFLQEFDQHVADSFVARRWQSNTSALLRGQVGLGTHAAFDYAGEQLVLQGGINSELLWKNYWFTFARVGFMAPGGWNPYETGDGAYLERLPWVMVNNWNETNSSKSVSAGLGLNAGHALGDTGWIFNGEATLRVKVIAPLDVSLGVNLGWEANDLRAWFDQPCVDDAGFACTVETDVRHYRLAQLDAGALSFTLRAAWTFSPKLSLQTYAQLFATQGSFHDRRVTTTMGPRPHLTRAALTFDPSFTGDADGDGRPDDAFQGTSLAVNVVLRWELAPGSTLIAVYTRGQEANVDLAGDAPRFRLGGLATGPTQEVLMMKLVYFYQ